METRAESSLYVIRVLPIVSKFKATEATYFSRTSFTPGSLITIPFRSKDRSGIVISSKNLLKEKAEIRRADFELQKIKKQKERLLCTTPFLETAKDAALYYATTPGEILSAVVPAVALEEGLGFVASKKTIPKARLKNKNIFVQGAYEKRLLRYLKEIQKVLSLDRSTLIVVPTTEDAWRVYTKLYSKFADQTFQISSGLTKKKQLETWNKIVTEKRPKVVIATTGFLSVPLPDLGLCIIEKSSSSQFYTKRTPYIDARVLVEILSQKSGAKLLYGDVYISLNETKGASNKELDSVTTQANVRLIDMVESERSTEERRAHKFVFLSKELLVETRRFIDKESDVFWFVSRRGLYPQTVCRDCGMEHVCLKCGSSLVLHEKKKISAEVVEDKDELRGNKNRFFLCHRCGEREEALATCRNCNSWRLEPLGIGIERVAEVAQGIFNTVIVLSKDRTPTLSSVKKALTPIEETKKKKGRLIIGTDLAFPFFTEGVPFAAIVSLDSRLALPSYNAEEMALQTLLSITTISRELCVVQSRRADNRIFNHINGQKLNTFRDKEARLRKAYLYPPFGTLLQLSFVTKKERAEKQLRSMINEITGFLQEEETITEFPLQGIKKKDFYRARIVVKLRADLSSNDSLREYVRLLSPQIEVRVDPLNLW